MKTATSFVIIFALILAGCVKAPSNGPTDTRPTPVVIAQINLIASETIKAGAQITADLYTAGTLPLADAQKAKATFTAAAKLSDAIASELASSRTWPQQKAQLILILSSFAIDTAVPNAKLADQLHSVRDLFGQMLARIQNE